MLPTVHALHPAAQETPAEETLHVLVIDRGPLLRRGLVETLEDADGIARVDEAGSIPHAWEHPALSEVDVVVLDGGLPGAGAFVPELEGFVDARVLLLAVPGEPPLPGAVAVSRETVTLPQLVVAVRAVGRGEPLQPTDLRPLRRALRSDAEREPGEPLTEREREVLRLVSEGLPTREVALELAYSERTVKKVLGDAVAKLGGRTRSQAIALAVRRGVI